MEAVARLRNYPTSPRKMRLLADVIRGMQVEKALGFLKYNAQHSSVPLEKLLVSAISNWKNKNEGVDESDLIVKTIFVDESRTLKRMMPAPQGRAYQKRKRSNHVTIIVDKK
ncbi:MAG: 50S ribosomal protein L22 [Chitinophagaceae bacterium]|nr:MAG: 50S ribosomal protein L22 [Bacteroidetes bacterium OLB11]MCC6448772.1 50S ribosomal protein L22 [Chitinophagaceae bacterium]HMN33434.1 50S ribosomal protein L22 [Chitinophagaceae bacterium]